MSRDAPLENDIPYGQSSTGQTRRNTPLEAGIRKAKLKSKTGHGICREIEARRFQTGVVILPGGRENWATTQSYNR